MKKNILLLLFLTGLLSLKATHNRSGEILYKRIAPFANQWGPVYTYSITLITYTDDGINVADRCTDTLYFGDGSKSIVYRGNGAQTCCGLNIGCGQVIVSDFNYKVKKNVYSIVHTYAGTGSYMVSMSDANRNADIVNIPNSVNQPFYIESMIVVSANADKNSSPVLTNPPTDKGYPGAYFMHNPAAFDDDGDSLSYELAPCKGQDGLDVPGYTFPTAGTGGIFNISNPDGRLSWDAPQAIGQYNVVIKIKEWRKTACDGAFQLNGFVTRDIQIVINNGPPPNYNFPNITDTCIVAGSTLARVVPKTSPYATVQLFGSCMANPMLPATITPTTGVANPTIVWQTDCFHIQKQPHQITIGNEFYGQPGNTHVYQQFKVRVLPPAVNVHSITRDTNRVTLRWHKLIGCSKITGYNVYRKAGPDNWIHGACENGVPASSGYHPVFIAGINDTAFTDIYVTIFPNGSAINYIVTATTNDCSESFAAATKSISLLVGIQQFKPDPSSVNIYPNPFTEDFEISFEKKIGSALQITIYSSDGKLVYEALETPGGQNLNIKSHNLPAGVYILQLKTPEGNLYKKLIKQ